MGKRLIAAALAGVAALATGCSGEAEAKVPEACLGTEGFSVRTGILFKAKDAGPDKNGGLTCDYEYDSDAGQPNTLRVYYRADSPEKFSDVQKSYEEMYGPCEPVSVKGAEEACVRALKGGDLAADPEAEVQIVLRTKQSVAVVLTDGAGGSPKPIRSSGQIATAAAEVVVRQLQKG